VTKPEEPSPVPATEPAVPETVNAFEKQGDAWTLVYRGRSIRLRDSKGLGYLAMLVAAPYRDVHVADLVGLGVRESAGLRSAGGPAIDAQAREAYRHRLKDLESERDEARDWGDLERAARAEEEISFLTDELAAAYGIGGRPRRPDDPTERMRKAVTNRIRHTVAKIGSVHPELGRHFGNSVRTGTYCSYAPETPVTWAS
jgi:hypothetical protein